MTTRSHPRGGGILGGPVDGPERLTARFPACEAAPGLAVAHRSSGFAGRLVALEGGDVVVAGQTGLVKRFRNAAGSFSVGGQAVHLVGPAPPPAAPALSGGRVSATGRTASGSRAVVGAKARVAQPSRILVEGVHDAELVEKVWGDDLRLEGVVVERLDGVDHLADVVAEFSPGPGRRLGVLVDHLVAGSKEARLAAEVRHPHVLVTGTPYVDVWEAVRPAVIGIAGWPRVPGGTPWKEGVCAALGGAEPALLWRKLLGAVSTWKDLETPFVRAVEELIDFVTDPGAPPPALADRRRAAAAEWSD
ncbi:MAG TPA: DUF3097 family protein [Acidimicrobiia bacterium]|nr:DUF3097 family protein [Acidimicrobiia bacterium]